MIKKFLILCTVIINLYSVDTTTHVTFTNELSVGEDNHGNVMYDREVKIETKNFKVDNFWNKFSLNGTGKSVNEFSSLVKTGKVRVSVESASICSFYSELDKNGCSGQKPFLINNEALIGANIGDTISLLFQKDYDLASDSIIYTDDNDTVFYPLDIDRNEKFYKEQADNTRSFFGMFGSMFNTFFIDGGFFSSFFNFGVSDKNDQPAEDIRQRYIANIVSGVDQDHLLEKAVTPLDTTILNTPVSLIDYTETVVAAGGCNLFFFKFPESSPFCSLMGAMPFISMFTSTTPTTSYEIDTIQADTENSLITFASKYTGMTVTEYQDGTTYQAQSDETSITNPIAGLVDMMKCFFFGCSATDDTNMIEEPMDTYYQFDDASAVNLMFAVTNTGSMIDDFQIFKLKGIHSLTGTEKMCRVKESNDVDTWTDYTFKPSGTESKTFTSIVPAVTETWCNPFIGADYPAPCGLFVPSYEKVIVPETVDSVLKTPAEWLAWCDTAIENSVPTTTEVCDYFFFFKTNCREVIDPIVVDDYEIAEYANSSKRGLLLDLELTELTTSSKAATLRYQLISTEY